MAESPTFFFFGGGGMSQELFGKMRKAIVPMTEDGREH